MHMGFEHALTQTTLFTFRKSVTYKIRYYSISKARYSFSVDIARKKHQVNFQESAE